MDIKWIIGDLHFGDNGMFKRTYSKKFNSKEDYIKTIVSNYNKKVHPHDKVLFLGDLGQGEELRENVPKMNGYKILILGNHDNYAKKFYNDLFDEVYSHPLFIHSRIVASHEPIPVEPGILNLHGHTHMVKLDSKQHINLCVEHTNYTPVLFKHFTGRLQEIGKRNIKFLQEWYKDIQIWTGDKRDDLVLDENNIIQVAETLDLGKVRVAAENNRKE